MAQWDITGFDNTAMDETLTLTFINLQKKIKDNIYTKTPTLAYFKSVAMKKGGLAFSHGLKYKKSTSRGRYARYETLDTTPQDGLTRDRWEMRNYFASMTYDGPSKRANMSEDQLESVVTEKREDAENTLADLLEQDFYASSSNARAFNSIPELCTNSGSVGNINGSSSTWWQAQVKSNANGWLTDGRKDLTNLCNTISQQNPGGFPHRLASDQTTVELWLDSLTAQERYTAGQPSNVGTQELPLFRNIPWMWSLQATSDTIFALHNEGIKFVVDKNTDFITTPFVKPANQDASTAQLLLACALSTPNRRKLGKMTVGS